MVIAGYFNGIYWGVMLVVIMNVTGGYLLTSTSFCVHRGELMWTEGDPGGEKDFGKHIFLTTIDHSTDYSLFWSFYLFAGFNNHIAHHLFPTVDHSRLPEIKEIIISTAKEFNMEYKTYSFSHLMYGMI